MCDIAEVQHWRGLYTAQVAARDHLEGELTRALNQLEYRDELIRWLQERVTILERDRCTFREAITGAATDVMMRQRTPIVLQCPIAQRLQEHRDSAEQAPTGEETDTGDEDQS